jgi:hypothetical protein
MRAFASEVPEDSGALQRNITKGNPYLCDRIVRKPLTCRLI